MTDLLENSTKYLFKDFTTANYKRLIELLTNNFKIVNFSNYNLNEKFAILRHDVDFSVHRALKIAKVEAKLGLKAHYYLLLHSEFYNLLEKENIKLVKEIISLGHSVGLHFDNTIYNINSVNQLEEKLILEKEFLERVFEVNIVDFAFHITNEFTNKCDLEEYGGMLNVYSKKIKENINYCSDSNGYWRYNRLEDLINNPETKNLQVLTHPELWQDEVMSPKQRVNRCADLRAEKSKEWYNNVLTSHNRENIDWQ